LGQQQAGELNFENENLLWQAFKKMGCEQSRNQLIVNYQPLVYRELGHLFYGREQRLDLIQEGTVGLIEAVDGFCPERGVQFATFARYRIRGRMLNSLEQKMENHPSSEDWEQFLPGEHDLQGMVERRFMQEQLHKGLNRLPRREKEVLEETVLRDRPAAEVACRLSITTSYLYRLRKRALRRLRGILSPLWRELKE